MSSPPKKLSGRERIARNLREWRVQRGFSQEKLSAHAGLTQTFLSQLEGGKKTISIDNIEKLAEVLDVDIIDLLKP